MVGKGKSIAHGCELINYIMKKEKAQMLRTNLLHNTTDPDAIWMEMRMLQMNTRNLRKANHKIDKPFFEFEFSPDISESEGWELKDYDELLDEIMDELNKVDLSTLTGRKSSAGYDLRNVQFIAAVHYDSKSGIPHIHLGGNRIGADGQLLDHHKLANRILEAVHQVNVRHGWRLPEDIEKEHIAYINKVCMKALLRMDSFSWDSYERILSESDLAFKPTRDSNGDIVNYVIIMGNSKYKSSKLGKGRNLTVKNIKDTWKKLQEEQLKIERQKEEKVNAYKMQEEQTHRREDSLSGLSRPSLIERALARLSEQSSMHMQSAGSSASRYSTTIKVNGKDYKVDVPQNVYDYFKDNCEIPEGNSEASAEDVIKVALLLFVGFIDAATTVSESCGGGGSTNDSGWGRKDDEDDEMWKKRCLMQAHHLCTPKVKYRRGRH